MHTYSEHLNTCMRMLIQIAHALHTQAYAHKHTDTLYTNTNYTHTHTHTTHTHRHICTHTHTHTHTHHITKEVIRNTTTNKMLAVEVKERATSVQSPGRGSSSVLHKGRSVIADTQFGY